MSHDIPPANEDSLSEVWQQFLALYPTEEDCMEAICRKLEEVGNSRSCRSCGSVGSGTRGYGERTFRCQTCRMEWSITAGTFFHRIRDPRAWLGAAWLVDHGVLISAADLARRVGVAGSTAQMILKKMSFPIESEMVADAVPSFLFKPVFCKRSCETPERAHPAAEQAAIEGRFSPPSEEQLPDLKHSVGSTSSGDACASNADRRRDSNNAGNARCDAPDFGVSNSNNADKEVALSNRERAVYQLLSQEPVSFDLLCQHLEIPIGALSAALTMMELNGTAVRLPGDRYALPPAPAPAPTLQQEHEGQILPAIKQAAAEFVACVQEIFQGISRKYLQNYLAIFSCHKDRVRWPRGSLLDACARFPYISYQKILAYISPLSVRLTS